MLKKVTGIGGILFKSNDPAATREWYGRHLGLNINDYGATFEWRDAADPQQKCETVWSPFSADTTHFAPGKRDFMINFRVADLEALLAELKKDGVEQSGEMQVYEFGKFAHIIDLEGNKIELWEPAAQEAEGEAKA